MIGSTDSTETTTGTTRVAERVRMALISQTVAA